MCEDDESGLRVDNDDLCPYAWMKLNCEIVVPLALDFAPQVASDDSEECTCGDVFMALNHGSRYLELDTPEYVGVIKERWLIVKLLTQGAIWLAAVLNWIFAEVDEDKPKTTYLTL